MFEELKALWTAFIGKADSHYVETEQAVEAGQAALAEVLEQEIAQMDYDAAVAVVIATAAELATQPELIDRLFAEVQVALAAKGVFTVEQGQANEAIAKHIREQAEADVATFDAQTALDEIKTKMSEFTL